EEQLAGYITKGNGLIYTGDYEKSNEILPLREIPEGQQSQGAKIMLVIDVSLSTQKSGSVKQSKKIGYSIADQLPYNNRVGLIAYNRDAYLVREPLALSKNREELKISISRLETGGNSFHHNGIKGAEKALNGT
ncbi:MAG: VWA domain-containing protein, partial [Candidatus Nanohaloarchaea archaeon]